jgi:hypothetical protein
VTPNAEISDADARYMVDICRDLETCLGPGTELLDLRREPAESGLRLVVRYRLGEQLRESHAEGETILAAHAELRPRIVVDRLRFGFSDLVERH